jgi:phage terminase small subunit
MSEEVKPLTRKQQVFVDEYLQCFNAAEAARRAGYSERSAYSQGWENLRKPEIKAEIDRRLDEVHMSADEALKLLADIGHSDQGVFWKIVDEWVFNPLPEYEILAEEEVIDDTKDPPEKRISYRVRHAVLDMDKIIDPRYSWMIKSFSNSRKFGLKIETHDKHAAIRDVLKIAGRYTDKTETEHKGQVKIVVEYAEPNNNANAP